MQTIKSKTTRDDKKMNRHPKNKTTKAENTKLYSLLIPLVPRPRQPPERLMEKQAIGVSEDPCRTRSKISLEKKDNDHNERKNNESIN